jgi:hypothetical protein
LIVPGLKNTLPSRVMAAITASSLSASGIEMAFRALTMSTLTLFCSMGVMTMKMISTTSITSTIGVTLISETGGGAFFCRIPFLHCEARGFEAPRLFNDQLA